MKALKILNTRRQENIESYLPDLLEFAEAVTWQKQGGGEYNNEERADILINGFKRLLVMMGYSQSEAFQIVNKARYEPMIRVVELKTKKPKVKPSKKSSKEAV